MLLVLSPMRETVEVTILVLHLNRQRRLGHAESYRDEKNSPALLIVESCPAEPAAVRLVVFGATVQ